MFALFLLSLQAPAQVVPLNEHGHILYRGQVATPGLTHAQVLTRAIGYARQHLAGENGAAAAGLVASAAHRVSGAGQQGGARLLRCELLVRADAGGHCYEVSDLKTEITRPGGRRHRACARLRAMS